MFTQKLISVRLLVAIVVGALTVTTGAALAAAPNTGDATSLAHPAAVIEGQPDVPIATPVAPPEPIKSVKIAPASFNPSIGTMPIERPPRVTATPTPQTTASPTAEPAPTTAVTTIDPPAPDESIAAAVEPGVVVEHLPVRSAPYTGPVENIAPQPAEPTLEPEPAAAIAPTTNEAGWAALRECESGGNYTINSGNGFYGAYQFTIGTWNAVAEIIDPQWVGVRPDQAPPAAQDRMANALRYEIAWGGARHWPVCGRHIA